MQIPKYQARHIIIESQGLNRSELLLEIINRLGYIQIDTLAVAERAHHHVLHSRSSAYEKDDLDQLMINREAFEYWSHAAAYLPISDYRFSLIKKNQFQNGAVSHWFPKDNKTSRYVLDRITAEGSMQSKDFKDTKAKSEWYNHKPAKIALEQLFMEGKLMIVGRKNFQKIYDLTEKVLPTGIDTSTPTLSEYCEYLIISTLRAQGLATIEEIGYLRKGIKPHLKSAIAQLLETQEVTTVQVEGNDQQYYMLSDHIDSNASTDLHILSPFDNLVIQRKRLANLFEFEYQIECYVPEAKRKYGYYVLPVLYKDRFVARFDPKADRKTGVFTIKNLYFEPNYIPDDSFYLAFAKKLRAFASFCGCQKVKIEKCSPSSYKKSLNGALKH